MLFPAANARPNRPGADVGGQGRPGADQGAVARPESCPLEPATGGQGRPGAGQRGARKAPIVSGESGQREGWPVVPVVGGARRQCLRPVAAWWAGATFVAPASLPARPFPSQELP